MTTYGDLLAATTQHLRHGNAGLATDRFWTVDQALDAIGDFHGMLQAVAAHTHRLLWPAKTLRPGMNKTIADLSPTERAAADLATGIDTVIGSGRPHPSQLAPLTTPWGHAAMHLRAASDLIAVHFRPDGSPRTPDAAAVTDTPVLAAGLVDLGHLAATILAAEEPLALRALQAGLNRAVVVKHLPGLGHLADLARALTHGQQTEPQARAHLAALTPTMTSIRTADPVTELDDRMHRLRQATWNLPAGPGDALATLRDVTTIGIAIHAHAAAFHGAQPATAADPPHGTQGPQALLARGRAWQTLHRELAHYLTLAPPHGAVREDLIALSRVLPVLAPLEARKNAARLADPATRRVGAALAGATATMTQIGDHSATTFAHLAKTKGLHLNARDLPRDLVTDNADLALARLNGTVVHAPAAVTDAILAQYDVVRAHPLYPPGAPQTTRLTLTPLEREVATITRHTPGR